jgi:hypothetical protein
MAVLLTASADQLVGFFPIVASTAAGAIPFAAVREQLDWRRELSEVLPDRH